MITDPTELAAQRKMTAYFIGKDEMPVALNRQSKVSNGQGGFTLGPVVTLPVQTFKLIPQSRQLVDRQTVEGVVVQPDHILLGFWNADIQAGDWLVFEGSRYDIVFVHEKNDFETTSEVKFRGKSS
jgi:hypothetical protein